MKIDNKNHESVDANKDGRISWSELDFKDRVGYITAIASFCLGWVLIAAGFIVSPLGVISGSVLSAFGTALLYCASVLGISLYFNAKDLIYSTKIDTFERELKKMKYNRHEDTEC